MKTDTRIEYEEAFGKLVGAVGARAFGLGGYGLVILLKALGMERLPLWLRK